MILETAKKNKVSLRVHGRSGCVQRQIGAKEVTAKSSAWLFANIVFKRLDVQLPVSTRLVAIFTGESAPAEILVFVWFC